MPVSGRKRPNGVRCRRQSTSHCSDWQPSLKDALHNGSVVFQATFSAKSLSFCETRLSGRKPTCAHDVSPQRFAAAGDDIADEVALVVDCSTLMRLLLQVPPVRSGLSGASHALFASGSCLLDK